MGRKRNRICLVCGKEFRGIASANTCSPSCRVELARLKAAQKRPEFILMAKGKGQKIPDLNAPKRLKFKKGEKKPKPEIPVSKIEYATPTESSFDGGKVEAVIFDEPGQVEKIKPMTELEKLSKKSELEKQIREINSEPAKPGVHVRLAFLDKQDRIKEIQKQIDNL